MYIPPPPTHTNTHTRIHTSHLCMHPPSLPVLDLFDSVLFYACRHVLSSLVVRCTTFYNSRSSMLLNAVVPPSTHVCFFTYRIPVFLYHLVTHPHRYTTPPTLAHIPLYKLPITMFLHIFCLLAFYSLHHREGAERILM